MAQTASELIRLGHQARTHGGDLDRALSLFGEAVARSREEKRSDLLCEALMGLGRVERDLGSLSASLESYEAAASIARVASHSLLLAHALRNVGAVARHLRLLDRSEAALVEALEIYRSKHPDRPLDVANNLRQLALLRGLSDAGEKEVLELWRETRRLYELVGVTEGVVEADRCIAQLVGKSAPPLA